MWSETSTSINQYKYQLPNGACADTFLSPNFDLLYQTAWGQLDEDYLECLSYVSDSIMTSVGVASSSSDLFASLGFTVLVTILFQASKRFNFSAGAKVYSKGNEERSDNELGKKSFKEFQMIRRKAMSKENPGLSQEIISTLILGEWQQSHPDSDEKNDEEE